MPLSLEDMCRTCMQNGSVKKEATPKPTEMVSLFSIFYDDASLMTILRSTVPQLKFEDNDKLPKNICLACTNKLKEIHSFQKNCLKVEHQFVELLDSLKSDDENSLLDIFNNDDLGDEDKFMKPELEDDIFVDNNSFQSDQFKDENASDDDLLDVNNDDLENVDVNDDDFIESCSDMSIDFVLDEESESDFEDSKKNNVRRHKTSTAKKANTPKQKLAAQELHPCSRCKKKLKSEASLKKHLELHDKRAGEERERKCICHICDRAFAHAYMLRDHLRSHSGEKPFLCSECGKGFTTSSSLKQHTFRHKSERQFTCPDCPKAFTTRTDLSSHSVVHKEKPRTHVCDLCGRGFTRAFVLKQHKMYHRNERAFSCEFCDKRFNTNEKLQRHTRIHTGEKPYKCKYCEKAYCQSNELTKHLRCHLGDNVYQCALCPQRFATVKLVKEHFILHKHDDEETRAKNLAELNAIEVKGIFCR